VPELVASLEALSASGVVISDAFADWGYAHRVPEHFALPLRRIGKRAAQGYRQDSTGEAPSASGHRGPRRDDRARTAVVATGLERDTAPGDLVALIHRQRAPQPTTGTVEQPRRATDTPKREDGRGPNVKTSLVEMMGLEPTTPCLQSTGMP